MGRCRAVLVAVEAGFVRGDQRQGLTKSVGNLSQSSPRRNSLREGQDPSGGDCRSDSRNQEPRAQAGAEMNSRET